MTNPITIKCRCRNNSDARRIHSGAIRIPRARCTYQGGHAVTLTSTAVDSTRAWLDGAAEIESYDVVDA